MLVGFIIYLVITIGKEDADFDDIWADLSTFEKIYWDNDQSSMISVHKRNMFLICGFGIFEGVLYILEVICMIGFMIQNPESLVSIRMPQFDQGGVDKLEY